MADARAPVFLVCVAFAGAASALFGGYWDDAWHTDRGRDEFLIAPHIAIYTGIAVAGAALSLWALLVARREGVKSVWRHKPLLLGLIGVAVTLGSGPIDNIWHVAFGRDAVIWSAPHMLGIAGTLVLAAALLAELSQRSERWAPALSLVAGALVLAPAAFATAEYDTDVPQFDELWYLPVLGLAIAIAFALIRQASTLRWAATLSAALYTLMLLVVSGGLAVLDFPAPALPLLIPAAVIVDMAWQRRLSIAVTAIGFAIAVYAAYVPVRNWLGEGVRFDFEDVVLGLPLTALAAGAVFALAAEWRPRGPRRRTLAAACLAATLLAATPALAHDPGQGEDAGSADVVVSLDGKKATLTAELSDRCAETTPVAVVARRAGETVEAPLEKRGCRFAGEVGLGDRGRWFVYAEMEREGRPVETWLPVSVGSGPTRVAEQDRYVYYPPQRSGGAVQVVAAVVLYAAMLGLLVAALRLVRPILRRAAPTPSR